MEFLNLVRERYSLRAYADKPVDTEKLALVLEAGRLAPTAKNLQPQHIYVLKGACIDKAAQVSPCTYGAPVVLVICYDKEVVADLSSMNQVNFGYVDTACIITHMMLQATELGLGTCWIGMFDEKGLRRALDIPDKFIPAALMTLGYPAPGAGPSERHELRKPLEEVVEFIEE